MLISRMENAPGTPLTGLDLPLLSPDGWIEDAEDTDSGEPLPNPFDLWLPPITKGRPTLLGGPTGAGKTALALQYYRHILDGGYSGAYITLEMTPSDLFVRFARQFGSEEECKEWIRGTNGMVSHSYITPGEIEQVMKMDLDFVVIDHAHELPYADRLELEREVNRLMAMAPAHNVALLMLAQLKRPGEFQTQPSLHDFKETGKFEQKGALVFQLWKEDEHDDYMQIWNTKNRFGPKADPLDVYLDKRTVTFTKV